MTTYPINIFGFLLDFFNMLLQWAIQLWNLLTQPLEELGGIPLWTLLLSVGAVGLVVIWLVKILT